MAQNRSVVFNQFWVTTGGAQGWQASPDWGTFPVAAILVRDDGPGLGQEWVQRTTDELRDLVTNLQDAVNIGGLVEIDAVGYTRQAFSTVGRTIQTVTTPDSGRWVVSETELIFGATVAAGQTIHQVLLYTGPNANLLNPSFDAEHELLMLREYATGQQTQGSQVSVSIPSGYLWDGKQAPDV